MCTVTFRNLPPLGALVKVSRREQGDFHEGDTGDWRGRACDRAGRLRGGSAAAPPLVVMPGPAKTPAAFQQDDAACLVAIAQPPPMQPAPTAPANGQAPAQPRPCSLRPCRPRRPICSAWRPGTTRWCRCPRPRQATAIMARRLTQRIPGSVTTTLGPMAAASWASAAAAPGTAIAAAGDVAVGAAVDGAGGGLGRGGWGGFRR